MGAPGKLASQQILKDLKAAEGLTLGEGLGEQPERRLARRGPVGGCAGETRRPTGCTITSSTS